MNRKMLMKLAVSGFALGITATGCSGTGPLAVASLKVADKAEAAAKSADRARAALEKGKAGKAVSLAEAAVAASPRDAGYRALLGQAYLSDGRFASAEAALGEAMELGARDANTLIALTLAYIARGNSAGALALLKNNSDVIPASDAGLALALAGDSQSAIYVLTAAARAPDASARTRQNLALAFALSGRWAQARILASQDLSPAKVEGRMTEWAKLAEARDQEIRVASLIGTKAKADAGMPVQLALANFGDPQMAGAPADALALASADPAPAESYAPPPPVAIEPSTAEAPIRTVELPMPERVAGAALPVTELPSPSAAAPVIAADAGPYRRAPRVGTPSAAGDVPLRLTAQAFDAANPSGWAVQLGAYDSLGIAKEKWGVLKKRNGELAAFPASSHAATVKGRTYYRLTVNGLKSRADASKLCGELKARGQRCFIRQMGGETIQWAAKATPVRMASR
ncbi:SPOR domain-containing protein [Sphingopyxis flava]|uniref:Sporulation related domain-containing protein n=1 Tax=Sphingopyxis flava TaxID=1507287 RepID=A0A1T4ZQV0_9SPHN|nr:SPOR domain-containing protein [Sphingopyxis flava]SKB25058.1 Sporulation related domain-containing protein [Sphingopyxis flava]